MKKRRECKFWRTITWDDCRKPSLDFLFDEKDIQKAKLLRNRQTEVSKIFPRRLPWKSELRGAWKFTHPFRGIDLSRYQQLLNNSVRATYYFVCGNQQLIRFSYWVVQVGLCEMLSGCTILLGSHKISRTVSSKTPIVL